MEAKSSTMIKTVAHPVPKAASQKPLPFCERYLGTPLPPNGAERESAQLLPQRPPPPP